MMEMVAMIVMMNDDICTKLKLSVKCDFGRNRFFLDALVLLKTMFKIH